MTGKPNRKPDGLRPEPPKGQSPVVDNTEELIEEMWAEFQGEWQENGPAQEALFYVVRFLREILSELHALRLQSVPEPLEAVSCPGRPLDELMRVLDERMERRMAEIHAPGRETDSPHEVRLIRVMHTAIEELNVAPQVAEYARRILMGSRPEIDMGVLRTLFGYQGVRVSIYPDVALAVPSIARMTPADLVDLDWCDVLDFNGPHTVLVLDQGVIPNGD